MDAAPVEPAAPAFAFEAALGLAGDRLRRYVRRRVQDRHESEEIVQEALVRACQHRHLFAGTEDVLAWTTVVAGRLVIDRARARIRVLPHAEVPVPRSAQDTADVVVAREQARVALDVLDGMPARQAAVLWAREVEGMSYDDISARYGLSEPTVRSLLHRARRTLRREYQARSGALPAFGVAVPAGLGRRLGWLTRALGRWLAAPTLAGTVVAAGVAGLAGPHQAPALARPRAVTAHEVSVHPMFLPPAVAARPSRAGAVPAVVAARPAARPTVVSAPPAAVPGAAIVVRLPLAPVLTVVHSLVCGGAGLLCPSGKGPLVTVPDVVGVLPTVSVWSGSPIL